MLKHCSTCGLGFEVAGNRARCFICRPHPKADQVLELYKSGSTTREVAAFVQVSAVLVWGVVRQLGKMRPPPYLLKNNEVNLCQDWIDGWLLGDGYIAKTGHAKTARFQHHCKYKDYASYVRQNFVDMGLECGRFHKLTGKLGQRSHLFQTQSHRRISEQLFRWYPRGKKTVPADLEFSPTALREWYIGDGTLTPAGTPVICNYDFPKAAIRRLVRLIRTRISPCKCRRNGKGHRISFPGSASQFFNAIGECPVPCYAYKWPA